MATTFKSFAYGGAAALIVWTLALSSTHAQVLTGSIIGIVVDESGARLPGATVTLTPLARPTAPLTVVTESNGEYRFAPLDPGVYALSVTLEGFSSYAEQDLRVAVSGTTERRVALKVGTLAETITVTGASPMIDPRKVNVATNLSEEVLENIPTGRFQVVEFTKWAPGVAASDPSSTQGSGNVSVLGSATTENSYLFDGIMSNSPNGGLWLGTMVIEPEEVQVLTLGASAEYQVAQGGVVNMVLKQGTNDWQFDFAAHWHPDALVSKPILLDCNCSLGQTGFTRTQWKDYMVHGGGPIVRDRLWFSGGTNYLARSEANPGVDYRLPRTRWNNSTVAKFTLNINDHLKFRQTFINENWHQPELPSIARPYETISESGNRWLPMYGSELAATLSDTTLLTGRFSGYQGPGDYTQPISGDTLTSNRLDSLTGISCCGVLSFGRSSVARHTASVKVNKYMAGSWTTHDLCGGVQLEWSSSESFTAFPGNVQYTDVAGAPDQATFREPFVSGASSRAQGVWVEDQMTLGSRFTVNVGARFDVMKAISPDLPAVDRQLQETGATIQGLGDMFTWKALAPRLGANYKITADGQTLVRATYGRAYRTIFLNDFQNVHPGLSPSTLARYNPATGGYTTVIAVTDPTANLRVDPNSDAPFTDQYSVGFDRQLTDTLGIGLSYVYKRGEKQIGWRDIGGVYGSQTITLANGEPLTVAPLLTPASDRIFLRTNGPNTFNRYNGIVLAIEKRAARGLRANVSYTFSRAEGLTTTAQDPNGDINNGGRLPTDRPHMLVAMVSYEVPRIGVQLTSNLLAVSGNPYAPQALVQLPQGRLSINIAPADGTHHLSGNRNLDLRATKILFRRGSRRIEITAAVENLLQDDAAISVVSRNFFAATFGQPATWIKPREMYFMLRGWF